MRIKIEKFYESNEPKSIKSTKKKRVIEDRRITDKESKCSINLISIPGSSLACFKETHFGKITKLQERKMARGRKRKTDSSSSSEGERK